MELQRKHNEQEDDKISPMSSNTSGTFSFHKCGWRLRLWIQNLWDTYITYPSEKIEEDDRISQLPEPIIHKILFRLNTKAVARTSILSKTWQRACSSFHRIDFRENYFNAGDIECPNYSEEENLEIRRKKNAFMNFIDNSLQSFLEQNVSMTKFTLKLTLHDLELVLPRVAKWLTFATERNVKKLDLSLVVKYFTDEHKSGEYVYYSLPHVVLEARTISVLRLSSCKLEPYNNFKFSDLKILDLRNVQLNEQVIQNLTLSCPLIEDFKLIRCHGFKDLKVSSLLRLNQFFVISCKKLSRIEIEAPSLQTFEFSNRKARRHCEFYLEGCKDLKTCTLRLHRRNNMIAELLQNLSAKCPTLEVLCIERYRLSRMKISCQTLKMLSLVDCKMEIFKISCQELKSLSLMGCKSLEAVELDTPNLVSLNCMMNKLPFYSINTTSLQEVGLTFDLSSSFTLCFDKLKELVGKFNGYEGLNLVIHSKCNGILLDELNENVLSLLINLEELRPKIVISSTSLSDSVERLLLDVPIETLSILSCSSNLLEVLNEKIVRRDFKSRCLHQHSLYDVKVENLDGEEDSENSKWIALLKLYETMDYQTTTFKLKWMSV